MKYLLHYPEDRQTDRASGRVRMQSDFIRGRGGMGGWCVGGGVGCAI